MLHSIKFDNKYRRTQRYVNLLYISFHLSFIIGNNVNMVRHLNIDFFKCDVQLRLEDKNYI